MLAVLLAGCGSTPPTLDLLLTAPVEVRTRSELPACGVELVGRGGPWNLEARQCFWDAYVAGRPAEFITTRPSGGGKPLVVIFRTLGRGAVELFADESAIYGESVWTWTTCPGFTATDDPAVPVDWVPGILPGDGTTDGCRQRRLGD